MRVFKITTVPLTEAAKRKLDQEMPIQQAMDLLQRKKDHHGKPGNPDTTGVRRVLGYGYGAVIQKIDDIRTAPPSQIRDLIMDLVKWPNQRADIIKAFLKDPSKFYIYDTGEKSSDTYSTDLQYKIIDAGYPRIYVGNKALLAQNNLDQDDFDDYCELMERNGGHTDQQAKYKGSYDRLQKRQTELQANTMHQASLSSAPAPTPKPTVNMGMYVDGKPNPYYTPGGTNQYNGPLSGVKWQKKGTKSMMDVFSLALAQLGYPLINIQYATTPGGADAFYATSANETVKIRVDGLNGYYAQLIGFMDGNTPTGSCSWLKSVYKAGDPKQTAANIIRAFPTIQQSSAKNP